MLAFHPQVSPDTVSIVEARLGYPLAPLTARFDRDMAAMTARRRALNLHRCPSMLVEARAIGAQLLERYRDLSLALLHGSLGRHVQLDEDAADRLRAATAEHAIALYNEASTRLGVLAVVIGATASVPRLRGQLRACLRQCQDELADAVHPGHVSEISNKMCPERPMHGRFQLSKR